MTDAEQFEIRQAFAVESTELLGEMESALLSLETDLDNPDEFNRLFRTIHTIKGSAGIVGHEPLQQFCHDMEHILVRVRERTLALDQTLIALFLTCHDHIRGMIEQFGDATGEQPVGMDDHHDALLGRLAAWKQPPDNASDTLDPSYYCDEIASSPAESDGPSSTIREPVCQEDALANAGTQSAGQSAERTRSSLRVDSAKLDQLSNLIIELLTASSVLEAHAQRLGDSAAIESTAHVSSLVSRIQEKSMIFRMLPVQSLFRRFTRVVHDIGKDNAKKIHLRISGGETELDKAVEEKLYNPLLHLVRNAVDHGIETASERIANGKSAVGVVHLHAKQDAGGIVISVSDDGQGINVDRIRRKGVELGLLKSEASAGIRETLNCIFEPGFSTLDTATTLSGRGVGLNVVKNAIESLRGRIEIDTSSGVGTTFTISIPLSLSIMDGFIVGLGEGLYILPMELVQETIAYPDISGSGGMSNGCLLLREKPLACIDLRTALALPGGESPIRYIVVVSCEGQRVGLIVDQLFGNIKAVIKPLGPMFRNVDCISGASILGDGRIALLLEMGRLLASIDR